MLQIPVWIHEAIRQESVRQRENVIFCPIKNTTKNMPKRPKKKRKIDTDAIIVPTYRPKKTKAVGFLVLLGLILMLVF
jgi:hypothetical protein